MASHTVFFFFLRPNRWFRRLSEKLDCLFIFAQLLRSRPLPTSGFDAYGENCRVRIYTRFGRKRLVFLTWRPQVYRNQGRGGSGTRRTQRAKYKPRNGGKTTLRAVSRFRRAAWSARAPASSFSLSFIYPSSGWRGGCLLYPAFFPLIYVLVSSLW